MTAKTVIDGRYELLAEIGRGAMGSVYRAKDVGTGKVVAVKILLLEGAIELARFNRESSVLAQLRHPNIVGYIGHGDSGGKTHYLVEEWLEGGTLRKRIRTAPGLTARDAGVMGLALAEGLGAAHALNVIHRDVKPENILLVDTDPAHLKLVDFGIARLTDPDLRITRTGVMLGTPAYMSPEQARGATDIGPTADVWGLGCVLYELLAGRPPFTGRHPAAIRAQVILEQPPDLTRLCPEAPPDLVTLVNQMLTKDPARRPADGAEVAGLLRVGLPIPDGPARNSQTSESKTKAMPVRGHVTPRDQVKTQELNCLMFVSLVGELQRTSEHGRTLVDIAAAHNLNLNVFDDGVALLTAQRSGRLGAVDMTRAARDVSEQLAAAAVSVAGDSEDNWTEALERAAAALEQCEIGSVFSDTGSICIEAIVDELAREESVQ